MMRDQSDIPDATVIDMGNISGRYERSKRTSIIGRCF